MKILIVDDEVDLNGAIKNILELHNYSVDSAYDGKSGLRKALQNEYDVILLDIMMPQMNGFEVVRHLRKEGRDTHVIMITAKDDLSDKIQGLDLGADDYIVKPFSMNELIARIGAHCRRNNKLNNNDEVYYGDVILNVKSLCLNKGSSNITLDITQAEVLKQLIKRSEIIVPISDLLEVCNIDSNNTDKIEKSIIDIQDSLNQIESRVRIIKINGAGYKICY